MISATCKTACFLILPFLFLGWIVPPKGNGVLTIVVNGIQTQAGSIRLVIYNSAATFLERDKHAYRVIKPVGNHASLSFELTIPHAYYAITCYHDINENQRLDQSALGYPLEPYAMSNNVNIKWRRPTFNETKFAFDKENQTINLDLKKWSDR